MSLVARHAVLYRLALNLVIVGLSVSFSELIAKALTYAVAAGLHPEYTSLDDIKDLRDLEGGLHLVCERVRYTYHR